MKKTYLVLVLCLFAVSGLMAQRTVTGKVTDDNGEGIPGATVQLKGTTSGVVTDIDGSYTLNVSDGDVLMISFIGFVTQEIDVGNRSVIDVSLATNFTELQEVVVTAIGLTAKKRDLGYSVQEVNSEEVDRANEVNLVAGLAGKAAGVQVTSSGGTAGAGAQIRIRGNSTIQGSNSPLFVVDGIPIDNSTFTTADSPEDAISNLGSGGVNNSNRAIDLNPNDIESLTVLKGPAATALYGVRAGNGAILITTKRGQKGAARINYSFGMTFDKVNKLPELQTTYAQGNVVGGVPTFEGPMTGSFTGNSWGPRIDELRYANEPSIWDPNGLIVHSSDPRATSRVAKAYNNTEAFFETGVTANHYLSASGGTDNINYYISVGYLNQEGIIPNNTFERTSVKATISSNLTDKLKATFSSNFINSGGIKVQNGSNTSGVMLGLLRTTPSFDNRGGVNPAKDPSAYQFEDGTPRAYRGQIGGGAIYDNPYWTVFKNFMDDNVNRIIGYGQLSYEFTDWFSLNSRVGLDQYSDIRKFRNDIGSGSFGVGQVINQAITNTDLNVDVYGTLQKELSSSIYINGTFGWNYYDKKVTNRREDGQGLASRGFFNAASAQSFSVVERPQAKQLYGVYGDVRISYLETLYLNITGRNDWSSTLGSANNSFFYPAVAVGWAFTENIDLGSALPYGKIRASYGKVGNDAPFGFTASTFTQARVRDGWTTPNGVLFPALGTNSFIPNNILGNPELKPEFTTTFEVGADLKFLNGRITTDITYYRSLTEDAIISVDLPYTTGFAQTVINAGEIENNGIEAVITGSVVRTGDFDYEIGFIFNKYESIVNEIAPGLDVITIDPFGTQRIQQGEPYGIFFGTRFLRDDQGRMVIDQNTGMPLQNPVDGKVGDPNPDFTLGFRNTFSYKNIELSMLFDFRQGGDVYNGTYGVLNGFGVGAATLDRNDRVVFPGVAADADGNPTESINTLEVVKGGTDGGTNFHQNYGFVNLDELTVQDGSWIRLRDVNISYRLPQSVVDGLPFSAITINANARNVFLITDYTGIDPETNLTGAASNVFGYDYFNNPNTKSYGFKLNVTL
ncbi:TonB-linked outer membrane protein, SusC/RagA family [Ekhidna lutea]|uniref:TonB-linked outer membrane protein, SusC/RagA family n=1 Tax=Ekhidna lutea TaxID=447679 RepID=A0A239M7Z0_EKHLU|nr:SusC/RagA family TonB-linked outer membrane protein [Ekhidna lutea]SNT38268.1 TonB-linked outer membrane protein, SusC/RagA family [Ekhidna lutea]